MTLILASKSKARIEMLRQAGIIVEGIPAQIDERALENNWQAQNLSAKTVALRLAKAKALNIAAVHHGNHVIGADQTLALGKKRFSKPKNLQEARQNLQEMRGKTHFLHSAVAIAYNEKVVFSKVTTAKMIMRDFSDDFLTAYINSQGEKLCESVGCYQYENAGIQLFAAIKGDYHTILGMPLLPLLGYLQANALILK